MDEIGRIARFEAIPGTWWEKARDMFMFSYFGSGINMKDILRLKYSNIDGEYIRFIRAKTHRTNRSNSTSISFHLTEELADIINRLGNRNKKPDSFIFPVLSDGISPHKEMSEILRNF